MTSINYNQARFLKSSAAASQFPSDQGFEVAFAGRSNAGKSSAINVLTGIGGLARTSKTPGRTQLINFFQLPFDYRLVDLPGYGFAAVPDSVKMQWKELIESYISERQSLCGLILLMDIRHPLTPLDWQMIEWSLSEKIPVHILLTKADKLKRNAQNNTLTHLRKELGGYEPWVTVQLFSAFSHLGLEELKHTLQNWFQLSV